jgi:hypothetical protein
MIGNPCHSVTGVPEGSGRINEVVVSVGGTGVFVGLRVGVRLGSRVAVGSSVGVALGSGVVVEVGRLVAVGTAVSVGFAARALQEFNATSRIKSRMALLMAFMLTLACVRYSILIGLRVEHNAQSLVARHISSALGWDWIARSLLWSYDSAR